MRRRLLAFIASAVLLPAAAAGSAAADDASVQAIGQQAASQQSASSSATSTQVAPSNSNVSVRIGSPGDGGAVTQTNTSSAASAAGNANTALQQAAQAAAGAGVQMADQSAANQQSADSAATSTQVHPQNQNISVRIMSPGDDGDVTQTNSSSATSAAGNDNATKQSAGQAGGGSGGVQHVGQKASNDQDASSEATSEQKHPSNVNVPVRIFSPGDDGDVTQTNSSSAKSAAGNANATTQKAAQDSGGGPSVQDAEQHASNEQSADSSASSKQIGASNVHVPVRIHSPGDDGSVTQTNSSSAKSAAGNLNATDQSAEQAGGGGAGDLTVQAIGQKAESAQDASSDASSEQFAPSNSNAPVRIKSPGASGDVTQANSSSAVSAAGNANWTAQDAAQAAGPSEPVIVKEGERRPVVVQAVGQWADNEQAAESSATSTQKDAYNSNSPVRIKSRGGDGDVDQANSSSAKSAAGNANATDQATEQSADPASDVLVQAIGQKAGNDQEACSEAVAEQLAPGNANEPVAVLSPGDGGWVEQSNDSSAMSAAGNRNALWQRAKERAHRVH
jgi:trimeric autotransporter adhesin